MSDGSQPNIVFILADNIGWGDFSVYGGTTARPRIDALANGGIRLNNYNVEGQCTPTPAGVVSQEMLTAHDWLPTLAGMAGNSDRVPNDRPIDGIDASSFMLGKSKTTGRESYLFFGPDAGPMSVTWKNIKVIFRYADSFEKPIEKPYWPLAYDLTSDPHENYNLMVYKLDMLWMLGPAGEAVADYQESVAAFPNVKPGEVFKGYKK